MEDDPRSKKTARLDIPMSDELLDRISALAVIHGFSSRSEYARDVFERLVYGEISMIQRYRRNGSRAMGDSSDE